MRAVISRYLGMFSLDYHQYYTINIQDDVISRYLGMFSLDESQLQSSEQELQLFPVILGCSH